MKSADMVDALAYKRWHVRKHVIVPNVSWGLIPWEADLMIMYPSGFCEEVEIKVSKADFARDFQQKVYKHKLLSGTLSYTGKQNTISRYWMAVPETMAEYAKSKLPDYAGLLVVREFKRPWGSIIKVDIEVKAPKIKHSRALTEKEQSQLMRLAYLRSWSMRQKLARADARVIKN